MFEKRVKGGLKDWQAGLQEPNLNVAGGDSMMRVEMPSVKVGQILRQKQQAYLWGTPEGQLRNFDGLLGPAALGATVVGFDFDRKVVSLETN